MDGSYCHQVMKASDLFNFPENLPFAEFFDPEAQPWEWLPKIKEGLAAYDWSKVKLPVNIPAGVHIEGDAYFHPSVKFPAYASIEGPVWIGAYTEIRPGAYIRGNLIVGEGCVLGNSCEYKNSLLLNNVESPHFNYVGDSILGNKAHLGAGAILANLRLDREAIMVKTLEGFKQTTLRKLGGLLGDRSEALCNSVIQPGTVLGKDSVVMSGVVYGGCLAENSIAYDSKRVRSRA